MLLMGRAFRWLWRSITLPVRKAGARRKGLLFHSPNFLVHPDLGPAPLVIDAGCGFQADFSQFMIRRFGATAVGVDPTRKHAEDLKRLSESSDGRFVHLNCALAAADGTLTFYESSVNESGSLLPDHVNVQRDPTVAYEVAAKSPSTLARDLGANEVAIMKMDLEGAEYDLIMSWQEEDLVLFRQLFVEFHHNSLAGVSRSVTEQAVRRVEGFGFAAHTVDGDNYLFIRRS